MALLLFAVPLHHSSPAAALWTTPAILAASVLITWGAESAQFFVAQGFALAILAWMQTLPEFAVEAVLAWKAQTELLMANLTGALRLLTGLAWPMIYATAGFVHYRRTGDHLRSIDLEPDHSVEVIGLTLPLLYITFVWWKASLTIYDAIVLLLLYVAYLALLTKLPPEKDEGIEDLESVPRAIVLAPRAKRNVAILACFLGGGIIIYFTAEPFLGSLVSLATAIGVPSFLVIQWLAPIISEFPELLSTFYFARQEVKAPVGLMNIVSSNINQWTLLVAMLPVVLSLGKGEITTLAFDQEQSTELALTLSQSVLALMFLFNMKFAWWEAVAMFVLFAAQFVLPEFWGPDAKLWICYAFLAWSAAEVLMLVFRGKRPEALTRFSEVWRAHVRS
ncbi:MAG: sodium/calcium exchanger protein [Bryobacteraceae bacterium]